MAKENNANFELATRDLKLLSALGDAAEDLANRAKDGTLSVMDRAALRNQARCANEAAGNLMARGAIDLFGGAPSDASKKIDAAIKDCKSALENISELGEAISFVARIIGVCAAILTGNWANIAKSFQELTAAHANNEKPDK